MSDQKNLPWFLKAAMPVLLFACAIANLAGAWRQMRQSKLTNAQSMVESIDTYCFLYAFDRGEYPKSLDDLVNYSRFQDARRDANFSDPWGNRIQYDPTGPRNDGVKPDIWTTNPSGKIIGNWQRRSD